MLKEAQSPVFRKKRYGGEIGVFNFLQVEKSVQLISILFFREILMISHGKKFHDIL